MAGFEWKYNVYSGKRPLILTIIAKNTETLTKGDIGNADTGEVDLAASGDNDLIGVINGAFDPADEVAGVVTAVNSVTRIKVTANPDAVYEATDANARNMGALLDLSGTTGAQGLTTASGNEFVVVETSLASEKTRVMIAVSANYLLRQ